MKTINTVEMTREFQHKINDTIKIKELEIIANNIAQSLVSKQQAELLLNLVAIKIEYLKLHQVLLYNNIKID